MRTRHEIPAWQLAPTLACVLLTATPLRASSQTGPELIVNTATDDDSSVDVLVCSATHCTLREAILAANDVIGPATIHFDIGTGQTITLTSELPPLTNASGLTIDGQASDVSVDGADLYRLLRVSANARATLANLTLENGSYTGSDCGLRPCGGGLKIETGAVVTLARSAIVGCTASGSGGGVFNAGQLTVTQSTLAGNSADEGGGMLNLGTAALTESTLDGNSALYGGGILLVSGGSLSITNSTLSRNSATSTASAGGGGALDLYGSGSTSITNSTVSGNTAVEPNQARSGVWLESGTLTLRNSIVADNAGTNNLYRTGGTLTSQGYNLSNAWNGMTLLSSDLTGDPRLGALADGGGPTQVMKLLPGSPAIDAITGCDGAPATDQCGRPRPQGAACDIGAYEYVEAPAITSGGAATFTAGSPGTFSITTTGHPVSTISAAGALPTGVTFSDHGNGTATLGGTPAAGTDGVYRLTLTAGNGVAPDATQELTLTVNEAPAITSPASVTFTAGTAGAFAITATGNPVPAVSIAGSLPAGVAFADGGDGTATLGGTPAAGTGGVYHLTLTAQNGVAPAAIQTLTLTIAEAPAIASAARVTFTAGTAGSFLVTATGVPTPAISQAGGLPSGVTFVDGGSGTATLSGTPAARTGGAYSLTLTATNGVAPAATRIIALTVNEAPAITSTASVTFTTGTADSFLVTTAGFPAPALGQAGGLPSGITFLDGGDGTATLSGTPAAGTAGVHDLTLTATNGVAPDAIQDLVLTVHEAPAITSAASVTFTAGTADSFVVTTTGFPTPVISQVGGLPSGITFLDDGDGTATLVGTPAAGTGGVHELALTAANGVAPDATQDLRFTVIEAPAITSVASVTFTAGTAGSFTVTTTGFPAPLITQAGGLPSGLTFVDDGDGTATLGGTPAAGTSGVYGLTLTAVNGTSPDATQELTLTVSDPEPGPAPSSPGPGGCGCASSSGGGAGTGLLALLLWVQRRVSRRRESSCRGADEAGPPVVDVTT